MGRSPNAPADATPSASSHAAADDDPIERQAIFGSLQRFELLGNIIDDPCNFAVHADTPVKNLQQLAAWARANPAS